MDDAVPTRRLYEQSGVDEYLIVLVDEERIDWRILERGSYRALQADASGVLKSIRFPGLWLNEPAFWRNDGRRLIATLEEGLKSAGF